MTNQIENGIYDIPTVGGLGIKAVHVIDGTGRGLVRFASKGWTYNFAGKPSPAATPLSDAQIAALLGYGLADDQRFFDGE